MIKRYVFLKTLRIVARKVGIKNAAGLKRKDLLSRLDIAFEKYSSPKGGHTKFSSIKQQKTKKINSVQHTKKKKSQPQFLSKSKKYPQKKPPMQQAQINSEHKEPQVEEKIYSPSICFLPGIGSMQTVWNAGQGNCFFLSVAQGLDDAGLGAVTQENLRERLSDWFTIPGNAHWFEVNIGATPAEIIPNLPDVGAYVPSCGWVTYLQGEDWSFWGEQIRTQGTWVEALELRPVNDVLLEMGINAQVNIYDAETHTFHGNDTNVPGLQTIVLA